MHLKRLYTGRDRAAARSRLVKYFVGARLRLIRSGKASAGYRRTIACQSRAHRLELARLGRQTPKSQPAEDISSNA